ncbi:MAG: GDSL-type esterase/lipase family protein [Thermodesulfovibrionales bacterium]|jgi:lysophospholipase L1-like esterase
MHPKKILFIGDSLIEFFDWQRRFPNHKPVNLGVAGETVQGLLFRIRGILNTYRSPDLIFIMTGINNVAGDDLDFIDTYKRVCKQLLDGYPSARIFINSLLPNLLPWISADSLRSVNRSIGKLAEESGAEYLDVYPAFLDEEGNPVRDYLLDDGVHLSDKGYAVWADMLEMVINR